MAQTYSTPHSRSQRRTSPRPSLFDLEAALLACAAVLCLVVTWRAMASKSADIDAATASVAAGTAVNLNSVATAEALAPRLVVFGDPRERQFVAREIVDMVSGGGTGPTSRRRLPNVGALSRITVESRRIRSTSGLPTLQTRLREIRERNDGKDPERLPVFTSSQIAALKPSLVVREASAVRASVRWHVIGVVAVFFAAFGIRRWQRRQSDPFLLPTLLALTGLGLGLMVSLRDPLRDVLLAAPFAQGVIGGVIALVAVSFVNLERSLLPRLSYVPLVGALVLSLLLVTLGSGPTGSDARVNLFGVQPVDIIRLLVTLFLAGYFARRWEVLRELADTGNELGGVWRALRPPRRQDLIPVVGGIAVVLVAFFLQKDLGPALMVACVFLAMYGVARGRWIVGIGGLLLLVAGFFIGHALHISSTLAARVEIWRSPWDNGARGGDQVAQALWALASGGASGTGFGHGMPQVVPAAHTDLILAALGEQLGFAGLAFALVLYGVIAWRGLRIATRAAGEYSTLLATGVTLGLVMPVVLITGGMLGLIPLTGVVTPFLSYGRSALIVNLAAVGLLLSMADQAPAGAEPSPFARGLRTLGLVGVGLAVVILGVAARTQTWRADEVMTAGALTRQGDGLRRFSYNPRLLAVADSIERGTIYDRRGVPLATNQRDVLAKHATELAGLGIDVNAACADATRRCYPFGGAFFHLLGDADTQINWGAPNASLVERDRDGRLRGYDDQARSVEITDPADGSRSRTIRRNLKVLLPLWRHRDDPTHPDAAAILSTPRDVTLTIDARLQQRVARLLAARVTAAKLDHGAAVVVDAKTGALLASVSYPFPVTGPARAAAAGDAAADALLDRARYGVFPPGSTFKLVTAAAVLRSNPSLADEPLICKRLDDGRVGNLVPGWRRPVRDDVNDTVPHGDVTLEPGIVHSCNAYFAQLGAKLGAKPLSDTAQVFDISLTRGNALERLRDTLPFASYGQGEVLATPFRMARVAGAIAADGVLAPPVLFADGGPADTAGPVRVLDVASARRLGDAMRQVVVAGTGRGLLAHPELVAGKTGTAEIEGAASHSWFVGFAPHGSQATRIAFAVILEHGGYGGRAAAPLAGDIVTAARDLGIIGASANTK